MVILIFLNTFRYVQASIGAPTTSIVSQHGTAVLSQKLFVFSSYFGHFHLNRHHAESRNVVQRS